jgi:hypothetical protein
MKKIFLMGQRSNRIPLAYQEYRRLFQQVFEYTLKPDDADFLVYSCLMDVKNDIDEIERIYSLKTDIRLVILSEEPLWDSLWSGDCFSKNGGFRIGGREYSFIFLNHWTTKIYDFEKIPYFITTCDDYFARYSFLFTRSRGIKASDLKSLWENAPIRVTFYAEFQDNAEFDAYFPEYDVWGLCRYRTLVAQGIKRDGVVRIGKRWGDTPARQLLPDWHLDKLAALNRRSFIVSGIENTHQWNYVSEKIFDAYAAVAIPLYFSAPFHGVIRFVSPESFINLYGLSIEQAVSKILSFIPDANFFDAYLDAQQNLFSVFSQPRNLIEERQRVVSEVLSEFEAL